MRGDFVNEVAKVLRIGRGDLIENRLQLLSSTWMQVTYIALPAPGSITPQPVMFLFTKTPTTISSSVMGFFAYMISIGLLLGGLQTSGGQQVKQQVIMEAYNWNILTSLVITLSQITLSGSNSARGGCTGS